MKPLGKDFYLRNPEKVAIELIGKILVRKYNSKFLSGKIVETEAYLGENDPASRAYKRKQKYYEIMRGEVGKSFLYVVHSHCMFNVIAHKKNEVGAVLIRAVEPLDGVRWMKENRKVEKLENLASGPGKLTQAMNLTLVHHGIDMTKENKIFIAEGSKDNFEIGSSRRIGVSKDLNKDMRFYLKGSSFVSK